MPACALPPPMNAGAAAWQRCGACRNIFQSSACYILDSTKPLSNFLLLTLQPRRLVHLSELQRRRIHLFTQPRTHFSAPAKRITSHARNAMTCRTICDCTLLGTRPDQGRTPGPPANAACPYAPTLPPEHPAGWTCQTTEYVHACNVAALQQDVIYPKGQFNEIFGEDVATHHVQAAQRNDVWRVQQAHVCAVRVVQHRPAEDRAIVRAGHWCLSNTAAHAHALVMYM